LRPTGVQSKPDPLIWRKIPIYSIFGHRYFRIPTFRFKKGVAGLHIRKFWIRLSI